MVVYQLIGYPLILLGIFQLILAILLFSKGTKNRLAFISGWATLPAAIYSCSSGLVYLRAGEGLDYSLVYRNCWIGWLTGPAILQLVASIAESGKAIRRYVVPSLYGFWTLIWVLTLTTGQI